MTRFTWHDRASEIIGHVHATLPADADLKTRKRALRAAGSGFRGTAWGRKVWGRAATAYLLKHGMRPRGSSKLTPTPLEQFIQDRSV